MVVCRTRSPTSIIRKIRPILICSFVSYCIKFINMHNYLQTEGGGREEMELFSCQERAFQNVLNIRK